MFNKNLIVTLLILSLSIGLSHSSYAQIHADKQDLNTSMQEQLQALVAKVQKNKKIIGLGAVVIQNSELKAIAVSGVRKKKSDIAVTVTDKWHIGSITKSITATALAALVESGQLDWQGTIKEYFSDESEVNIDSTWNDVTLHDLLTHTSGAPANFPMSYQLKEFAEEGQERSQQRQKAVLEVLSKPIKPGNKGKYAYSNVGYTIAGHIAEQITEKSWEALVRELVYQPLKLESAGFSNPNFEGDKLSQPRGHQSIFGFRRAVDQGDDNNPIMGPAGIAHMSLTDLASFANEHLQGAKGTSELLSKDTFEQLHTPDQEDYAYGWVIFPEREWANGKVVWHNGSNTMWYAIVAFLPELDAVMAVTANEGRVGLIEKEAIGMFKDMAGMLEEKD